MAQDFPLQPVLVVESGLHRFASRTVPSGESLIGAAVDNAIVITDHAAGVGFKLKRSDADLIVQAVDANLDIKGKTFRPGQHYRCSKSFDFRSGGIQFRLELPAPTSHSDGRPFPSRGPSHAGAFAGGVISAGVLTLAASLYAAPAMRFPSVSLETTGALPLTSSASHAATGKGDPTAASILDDLRRQLAAKGLDTVALAGQADGSIEASGKITPAQDVVWHETGRWFDTAARGRTVLVDHVQTTTEAPPLQIQAVWPGRNPYVMDGSGEKLFVGSMLSSGWSIHGIEATRVLIKRGEQIVAVRF